jgi:hypothetical protein
MKWVPAVLPWGISNMSMKLSTDSHPVPRLIMCVVQLHLFIVLSNDASSLSHDYIASNERMINE